MEQTITVDHHNNPKKHFMRSILDHENEEGSLLTNGRGVALTLPSIYVGPSLGRSKPSKGLLYLDPYPTLEGQGKAQGLKSKNKITNFCFFFFKTTIEHRQIVHTVIVDTAQNLENKEHKSVHLPTKTGAETLKNANRLIYIKSINSPIGTFRYPKEN